MQLRCVCRGRVLVVGSAARREAAGSAAAGIAVATVGSSDGGGSDGWTSVRGRPGGGRGDGGGWHSTACGLFCIETSLFWIETTSRFKGLRKRHCLCA